MLLHRLMKYLEQKTLVKNLCVAPSALLKKKKENTNLNGQT